MNFETLAVNMGGYLASADRADDFATPALEDLAAHVGCALVLFAVAGDPAGLSDGDRDLRVWTAGAADREDQDPDQLCALLVEWFVANPQSALMHAPEVLVDLAPELHELRLELLGSGFHSFAAVAIRSEAGLLQAVGIACSEVEGRGYSRAELAALRLGTSLVAQATSIDHLELRSHIGFDAAPHPMALWSRELRLVEVNRAWLELIGPDQVAIGSAMSIESEMDRRLVADLIDGGLDMVDRLHAVSSPLAGELMVNHRLVAARDGDGEIRWLVSNMVDVTAQYHQATHDGLTGLRNRSALIDRLGHCLVGSRLAPIEPVPIEPAPSLALLFLDLDGFKSINDRWGHAAGDRVLVVLAERIQAQLRSDDFCGRLGGDEFAVVLQDGESPMELAALADRIQRCVGEPVALEFRGGPIVEVRASIGIAVAKEGDTPTDVLREADRAMYEAKRRGPGRYAFADEVEDGFDGWAPSDDVHQKLNGIS